MSANRDNIPLWALSGIIGVLIRDLWSIFAKFIGLAKFQVWQIGADVFIEPNQVNTFLGTIVGFLTDFVTGSLLGVLFGYFIKKTGKEYCLLKGLGAGLLAWLFLFGILFHSLPHTQTTAPKDPFSVISAFIGHSVFGLSLAYSYMKLTKADSESWKRA
jgi:Na+/proline symporter